jgi:hypothetical protein
MGGIRHVVGQDVDALKLAITQVRNSSCQSNRGQIASLKGGCEDHGAVSTRRRQVTRLLTKY